MVRGMVKWLLLITLLNQTQMGFRRTQLVKCEYLQDKRMYWPGCDVLNRFELKFQCLTCKVESPERIKLLENPSWKLQKMFPNGFSIFPENFVNSPGAAGRVDPDETTMCDKIFRWWAHLQIKNRVYFFIYHLLV